MRTSEPVKTRGETSAFGRALVACLCHRCPNCRIERLYTGKGLRDLQIIPKDSFPCCGSCHRLCRYTSHDFSVDTQQIYIDILSGPLYMVHYRSQREKKNDTDLPLVTTSQLFLMSHALNSWNFEPVSLQSLATTHVCLKDLQEESLMLMSGRVCWGDELLDNWFGAVLPADVFGHG